MNTLRTAKKASPFTSKIKLASIVMFLTLSLGLLIGIVQTPQDIRQHAQNTPGRVTTPPQCAASGGQPNTGLCVAKTEGCLPGEEQDEGQLDCAATETCCSLAEVPQQCAEQSNGQTFCSAAANCSNTTDVNLGPLDCVAGTICCKNTTFPTTAPSPSEAPEPTIAEDPTPTFGSISGPGEDDPSAPTEAPAPQENPQPAPAPSQQQNGLIQLILLLITFILGLLGRNY